MIISGRRDRSWNDDTSSVDSLPNIAPVYSSRHLLNQDWGKSFRSQRLMDAEEIDFSHGDLFSIDVHMDWNSGYESE